MSISGQCIDSWIDSMSKLTATLMSDFEARFGYPPDENVILTATPESGAESLQILSAIEAHSDLLDFYSRVEEVSLPDVANGFFISSAEAVVAGIDNWQPVEIVGAFVDTIVVFGSDGGGGLFALNSTGEKVYHLTGGALVGSSYDADEAGAKVISADLWGFLEYLRSELAQMVYDRRALG